MAICLSVCLSLSLSRLVATSCAVGDVGGCVGRVSAKSGAARYEMKSEEAEEVHPRYFDSIIHFCRSTSGCCSWGPKTSEKDDIGKQKYIAHRSE
jgi:hypothetical protein